MRFSRLTEFGMVGACALAIAACGQQDETVVEISGEEETAETDEAPSLTPVDTPSDIEPPALAPVSRVEIEAELEPGAGCSVEEDGKALLVAVEGDAIARPYGTMRHFSFEGEGGPDAFWDGGTFVAGVIRIVVEPADGEGEQIEGMTVRQATVTVSEEGQTGSAEIVATWECGA